MTIDQNYRRAYVALKQVWKKLAVLTLLLGLAQIMTTVLFFPAARQAPPLSYLLQSGQNAALLIPHNATTTVTALILMLVITSLFALFPVSLLMVVIKNRTTHTALVDDLGQFGVLLIPLITTWFIAAILATVGFVALIVPGIILSVLFAMFPYLVIYRKLYNWKAITYSARLVRQHIGQLLINMLAVKVPVVAIIFIIWKLSVFIAPLFAVLITKISAFVAVLFTLTYVQILYESIDR